jgi:S1-C subfamily serine protease
MKQDTNKFIAYLAIISTPFALGAFFLAWSPSQQFSNEDPAGDGYVPPRSIERLVDRTQESTVTVWCEPKDDKFSQGTAWAIELKKDATKELPTVLITNHHVIDTCIGKGDAITVALPFEDPVAAELVRWDAENDLAVLRTKLKLPVLALSEYDTFPGYWVMALGSADGYEGSVAFGNVINSNRTEILVTNNISSGSSGGALVDNEGNVVGVMTWSLDEQQYNGAVSLNAFCVKILECKYEIKGEKTWWDYNG